MEKRHKKITFLFPGQGAQYVGMGKDFAENYPRAKETFEEADDLLGRNLSKIIFEGATELLTETINSQPAIYVTSMAILRVLEEQFPDLKPTSCAGLSLGEYTALTASLRLPFASCLPLVQYRGECMNEACETTSGTMAAIFGLSAQELRELVKELNLPQDLWVANFNCPGQTVISGTLKGVEAGIEAAKAKGARRVIPLRVHGAFHSGLMALAEEKLAEKIAAVQINESSIGLTMNAFGGYVREVESLRRHLIEQVTHPVRWEECIRAIQNDTDLFIEIGCGKTLTGINKQIGVTQPTLTVNKVSDLESLLEIL